MTTVFLHHYFVPQKSYGYTYLTNFHEEFDNADHIGIEAIKETFHKLFNQCKENGPLATRLLEKDGKSSNDITALIFWGENHENIIFAPLLHS